MAKAPSRLTTLIGRLTSGANAHTPAPTAPTVVDADLGASTPEDPMTKKNPHAKAGGPDEPEKKDDKDPAAAECNGQCPRCCSGASNAGDDEDPEKKKDEPGATAPKAASISELKAAFPGNAELALEAAENGWSIEQAKAKAWDRAAAAQGKKDGQERMLRGEGRGAAPLAHSERSSNGAAGGSAGPAKAQWPDQPMFHTPFYDQVATRMQAGASMSQAIREAKASHPDLFAASNKGVATTRSASSTPKGGEDDDEDDED